jgi:putative DNA primase/helicase
MLRRLLGFDAPSVRSAMLLPFRAPAGGFMDHVRVKVFPSLTDAQGHTTKYLGPRGVGPRLYFCVPTMAAVIAAEGPVWLVEGAKKALAVAQVGLPAVGFEGIEGWHTRGSLDLLPDFDAIPLRGRTVELVPDADWQTNPAVERGVRRLGEALILRGARPRIVVLPQRLEPSPP